MKRFVVRSLVGLILLGVVVAAVVAWTSGETPGDRAVVTRLVDGDTLVADFGNRSETVRLLNVDAPETKDPGKPVECLGPEAAAFLESMVPVGSEITLQYDEKRLDRYGRTLAGVLTPKGVLVNAEIARAGLGTAVVIDGNDRFLPAVQAAQQEAAGNGRGLYSKTVTCTLPVQVAALVEAVSSVPTAAVPPPSATASQLDAAADKLDKVCDDANVLVEAFRGDRSGPLFAVLTRDEQDALAQQVFTADTVARSAETELRSAAAAAKAPRTRAAAARPDSAPPTAETAAPRPGG